MLVWGRQDTARSAGLIREQKKQKKLREVGHDMMVEEPARSSSQPSRLVAAGVSGDSYTPKQSTY